MQSADYAYQLSGWNLKKQMGNKMKINRDQETHYIRLSVCSKFEEFVLIHGAMNAEQGHSYVPLKLLWQGTKS